MAYFDEYDVAFSDDGKVLERCPETFEGAYKIPFGVEEIGEIAFKNCAGLAELSLPRTIKTLKAGAFEGVKSLARLNYEGSLDEWFDVTILCYINSSHTFYVNGEQLTELVIPKTRTIVPKRAFYYVHGLNSVVFHDEIIEIEDYAFNKSSISGRIVLPPKLKRIGDYAFLSCQQMTGISIPPTVQKIGEGAFRYCRKVSRYEAHDNPWYSHYGLDLCTANYKVLLAVHNSPSAREFKVMSEIETIPDYVFSCMPESVKEIILPFGIKRIGKKAFDGYNGKIVIPDSKAELLDSIGIPRDRVVYSHNHDLDFKESSSQNDSYASIMKAIEDAKNSGGSVDELEETSYSIFDAIDRQESGVPVELLYQAGIQMITNLEKAILLSTNRKQRLVMAHNMAYCHKYLIGKDKNASVLQDSLKKIKEPLDIIPPYDLIEQDCEIYDSMISWMLCNSITELVQNFYPIIAPLSSIYVASFKDKEKVDEFRITTTKGYLRDECDLVAEMVCNNVLRIFNDRVKTKWNKYSLADAKDLQLAYSLLTNCKKNLILSKATIDGVLSKTIGAVILFMRQHGLTPSYLELFTLQPEEEYWKAAQNSSTALLKYLTVYGKNGKHLAEANALIAKNEKDDEAMWKNCKTMADYEAYLKKSPTCAHKNEAEEKISKKRVTIGFCVFLNIILIVSAVVLFILIVK